MDDDAGMDDEVWTYIDGVDPRHRTLFDRIHNLILEVHPQASVSISHNMPSYKVGKRRMYIGSWKHGVSVYGWDHDHDGGFAERHPDLMSGKGTLQLRPDAAAGIDDEELRSLVRAALDP
jgi:uncharacterized protein YdhG (YjbR/CyaY superfamily)